MAAQAPPKHNNHNNEVGDDDVEEESLNPSSTARTQAPSSSVLLSSSASPPPAATMSMSQCLYQLWVRGELYRGVHSIVLTLATSNFIFFWVQSALRQWGLGSWILHLVVSSVPPRRHSQQPRTNNNNKINHSQFNALVASIVAGILNVLLTNPLWVANLQLVAGSSSSGHNHNNNHKTMSLPGQLWFMIQTRPWYDLWKGTGSSLWLVSNPVLQWICYERLRTWWLLSSSSSSPQSNPTTNNTLSPTTAFWMGALSKAIATLVTYPLQVSQAVLRLQQEQEPEPTKDDDTKTSTNSTAPTTTRYKGTVDCLWHLYQRHGVQAGWYRGFRAKLIQTVLTAALTFLTYEQILWAIHQARIMALSTTTTTTTRPWNPTTTTTTKTTRKRTAA